MLVAFKHEKLKSEMKEIPGFLKIHHFLFLIIYLIFDRSFAGLVFYSTKIPLQKYLVENSFKRLYKLVKLLLLIVFCKKCFP